MIYFFLVECVSLTTACFNSIFCSEIYYFQGTLNYVDPLFFCDIDLQKCLSETKFTQMDINNKVENISFFKAERM